MTWSSRGRHRPHQRQGGGTVAPAPGWRHGGATASTSARMAALHHRQHQRQGGGINMRPESTMPPFF